MSDDESKDYKPPADEEDTSSDEYEPREADVSKRPAAANLHCRSLTWTYFDKIADQDLAECRVCGGAFSYKSTITNLRKHLKRKHPNVYDLMMEEVAQRAIESPKVVLLQDGCAKVCEVARARRQGRHRSLVWRWFTRIRGGAGGGERAQCGVCRRELSFAGGLSNLRAHLKRSHAAHFNTLCELREKNDNLIQEVEEDGIETEVCDDLVHGAEDPVAECVCSSEPSLLKVNSHREGCPHYTAPSCWDYFDKIDSTTRSDFRSTYREDLLELDSAQCRLCESTVSWSEFEDLRTHLLEKHPGVALEKEYNTEESHQTAHEVFEEILMEESDEEPLSKKPRIKNRKVVNNTEVKYSSSNVSDNDWRSSLDRFGLYVASLMKMLPRAIAAKYQVQIIDRLTKERIKYE